MMKELFSKRGFTLIELIVVVAIIGLLAAIVIGAITVSTKKGRDAKRLTDLKTIATALELYRLDKERYPLSAEWATGCDHQGTNWIPDGTDYNWTSGYLRETPRDPREDCNASTPRSYSYQSDGENYKITAELETPVAPSTDTQTFSFDGSSFQPFVGPLTVSITSPYTNPTNQSPIAIIVTFSRTVVDFTQESLSVLRGFVSDFLAVLTSLYNLAVTPTDNDSITVSLSGGVVHDAQGVGNLPAQFIITYDSLRPHVALSPDPLPAAIGGSFSVQANFTIAVVDFDASDISVQNGSVSNFTMVGPGSGVNFTFTVTPTSAGPIALSIPVDAVHSAAGNSNIASNILSTNYSP